MKPYTPISCALYDHIEIFAMRGKEVSIVYLNQAGESTEIQAIISDTLVKEGEEFVVLNNGTQIRMDMLLKLGEVDMSKKC